MNDDSPDTAIATAIASYAREPSAGLEVRILCHVAARRRWRFALPAIAAAVLAGLLTYMLKEETPKHPPSGVVAANAERVVPRVHPPVVPPSRLTVHASLPKQEVFPAFSRMSEGERALLLLTSHDPDMAARLAEITMTSNLEIEPLEIRPLQTGASQ